MLQTIEGKLIYVVEFDTMPEMPITGLIEEEAIYEYFLSMARGFKHPLFDTQYKRTGVYTEALMKAFKNGIITEPGKYGIHIDHATKKFEIYKLIEQ